MKISQKQNIRNAPAGTLLTSYKRGIATGIIEDTQLEGSFIIPDISDREKEIKQYLGNIIKNRFDSWNSSNKYLPQMLLRVDKRRSKEENLCIRRWNTSHRSWRVNYQKTLFWSNQHLSSKGIKYPRNSLKMALFSYFGIQYSTERFDMASEKRPWFYLVD